MERISWPNRITITRIVLVMPFVVAVLNLQDERWGEFARYWALAIFVVMAISDFLDGYLARRLNQMTTVGRFLDPTADMVLLISSVSLLAHHDTCVEGAQLPAAVAVIVIGKEIIQVVGFCVVYIETGHVHLEPVRLGKWCVALLMAMIAVILASPNLPALVREWFLPGLWWTVSVLAIVSFVQYFQRARVFIASQLAGNESPGQPPVDDRRAE